MNVELMFALGASLVAFGTGMSVGIALERIRWRRRLPLWASMEKQLRHMGQLNRVRVKP